MRRGSPSTALLVCLATTLAVGIVLEVSGAYASGTWSTPQRLDTPMGSGESPRIALSSSGNGVAVYTAWDTGTGMTRTYATRLVNGAWQSQTAISGTAGNTQAPQVAAASDGSAVAVWMGYDGTNWGVYGAEMSASGSWGTPRELDDPTTGCGSNCNPQIALYGAGYGATVYANSHDANVYGVSLSNHVWGTATRLDVPSGESGKTPMISIASDGSGMVAWAASSGTSWTAIKANTFSSGSFGSEQTVEQLSGSSPSVTEPQVRMTGSGKGVVAYLYNGGSGITAVRSASFSAGTFGTAGVAAAATYDGMSLGASSDGGALLVYSHKDGGGTQHLYAKLWSGSSWGSEAQVDNGPNAGDHYAGTYQGMAADLADASDGWVLYDETTSGGNGHAMAAQLVSSAWQTPVQLDSTSSGFLFQYTPAIQVLSSGAAGVAYDLDSALWGAFLASSSVTDTPPVASFSCSTSGLSASCDGSASHDPDGTVTSYAWSWGDGSSSSGATASHTYARSGSYTVTLTVTDNGGQTGSASHVVAATSTGGIAPSFAIARQHANPGEAVHLDASGSTDSGGTITSYAWDFGDGATGSGVSAWHTYAAVGRYTVTLTETDSAGSVAQTTQVEEIDARNVPPAAAFTVSPAVAWPGKYVSFDASSTTDPDDPLSSLTFTWDLGDGTWASGATVSHLYAKPGTYTVTLTARDPSGGSSSSSHTVTVAGSPPPAPPTFAISPGLRLAAGQPFYFDVTSHSTADLAFTFGDGASAELSYGSGGVPSGCAGSGWGGSSVCSSGPPPAAGGWDFLGTGEYHDAFHIYSRPGTYDVTLQGCGPSGLCTSTTQRVTVTPAFAATPDGTANGVRFAVLPQGLPGCCTWAFGDGSPGTGTAPDHTYPAAGTYDATMVIGYPTGDVAITQTVTAGGPPPTARIVYSPHNPTVGTTVSFSGALSKPGGSTIASYRWGFGDGGIADARNVNHVFHRAGRYHVVLVVEDDNGLSDTASVDVVVGGASGSSTAPPRAAFTSRSASGLGVTFDASGSSASQGATIASYAWDFGDGAGGSGVAPTHAYASAGPYLVTLHVTDTVGGSGWFADWVTPDAPPTPAFTVSPVDDARTLAFDAGGSSDTDGDAIASYVWDFGDGTSAFGQKATHTFPGAGSYQVTLTVRDTLGGSAWTTQRVTTYAVGSGLGPLHATFAATEEPAAPPPDSTKPIVDFSADGSTSPNGIGRVTFDFGDGSNPVTLAQPGGGLTTRHVYAAPGTYTVTLTVADSVGGATTTDTRALTLTPPAPPGAGPTPPSFTIGPAPHDAGETQALYLAQPTKGDLYSVDWGDGNVAFLAFGGSGNGAGCIPGGWGTVCPPGGGGNGTIVDAYGKTVPLPDVSHAYEAPGTYTITASVSDPWGRTATWSLLVLVEPAFVATVGAGAEDMHFAILLPWPVDTTACAPDCPADPTYTWSFGDGATATGTTADHTFAAPGKTAVTVTVDDPWDTFGAGPVPVTQTVWVGGVPPTAAFTYTPARPSPGTGVRFDASATVEGDNPVASYSWSFGDGSRAVGRTRAIVAHAYAKPGTYRVVLTVVDDAGLKDVVAHDVVVPPPA